MRNYLRFLMSVAVMLVAFTVSAQNATMTVSGTTYTLSEETAIPFGTLPAGTTFSYTCEMENTKTVYFEIYDVTAGEGLKSGVQLYPEEDGGSVSSSLALKYDLANGHAYEARFKEYNVRNGISAKTPTATHNYKFAGTANVAVYSTVKMLSYSPSTNTSFDDLDIPVTLTFSEAIASLSVKAVLGQMSSVNVPAANITTEDNITWKVKITEDYINEGSLQLNFYATDKEGNRLTDPQNGVGTPETCYINLGWASVIGLPTPTLVQNNKTVQAPFSVLQFMYDGIGVNQDNTTSTLKDIKLERDGKDIPMTITESMFTILGKDAGSQMDFTLPEPLAINGEYTLTLPARAFMLGHDNSNYYNGPATYKFTVAGGTDAPTVALNLTKTTWATIGSESGETIGTVTCNNIDPFDHITAEIKCTEDADQYITFADVTTNGGNLVCYAWEGGHHNLYKGYHYTLTVNAFDVPYYGAEPVATTTYEFVGQGIEPTIYSDIVIESTTLTANAQGLGWDCAGDSFDVTFSAPVTRVQAWWAKGMEGSTNCTVAQKDVEGLVWTITLPDGIEPEGEGMIASANIMITAWDADNHQTKGENGDHAFAYNVIPQTGAGIANVPATDSTANQMFNIVGQKVSSTHKGIVIVNGHKILVK